MLIFSSVSQKKYRDFNYLLKISSKDCELIKLLAAKCGVSVTYISMVERGVCNPTDSMKNRIFNAFVV